MCKDSIDLTNITKIPSGRAIAARFQDLWITNVYATPGTAKKPERERFFASYLTYILEIPATHLVGGDFNAILNKNSTGHYNYSWALCYMVQGLAKHDVWQHHRNRKAYTH
jgi:exonuclease III